MSSTPSSTSVLMCCSGNICRSPMAEALLLHHVKKQNLSTFFKKIDSCGTHGFHVGESADYRTLAVCKKNGVVCPSRARKLRATDFDEFDYIFGMDSGHVRYLRNRASTGCNAKILLFGSVDDNKEVDDPYYGYTSDFEDVYVQCDRYARKFIRSLGLPSGGA